MESDKQTGDNTDNASENSIVSKMWGAKELFIPAAVAILTGYLHFWGYAFFKGKLQRIGLGDIEIVLSIPESVYQASLSFYHMIDTLVDLRWVDDIGSILMHVVPLLVVFALFRTLYHYLDIFQKSNSSLEFDSQARNKQISIAQSAKLGGLDTLSISLKGLLYLSVFSLVIGILALSLTIPRNSGFNAGWQFIRADVCHQRDIEKLSQGRVVTCTKLTTTDGELHTGVIMFKNSEYTILITNENSLLLSATNDILAWSPIIDFSTEQKE